MLEVGSSLYFIGIGGSGMAPLAELALQLQYIVKGSDLHPSAYTQHLGALGAKITYGQQASTAYSTDTVIISSAIKEDNPELLYAKHNNIPIIHRSDFLLHLCKDKQLVAIAGTHGKTTSTAMIAFVLRELGEDPCSVIGGTLLSQDTLSMCGSGTLFVAEIDESDGTIVKFAPHIGILTNVDNDHMDFYKTSEDISTVFLRYLNNISAEGVAVLGWDNKWCRDIGGRYEGNKITYGFVIGCDVRAVNYVCNEGHTSFTAVVDKTQIPCKLNTFGKHNAMNALCTLATVKALNLDVAKAAQLLEAFPGVNRRCNLIYEDTNVKIFDDYAHNPGKMSACILALKETFPDYRLYVLFQPHRFSRLKTMYQDMASAFIHADRVYVYPVYSAGEVTDSNYTPQSIARDIEIFSKTECIPITNEDGIIDSVQANSHKTILLSLGAGDIYKVSHKLRDYLNEKKQSGQK